MVDGFFYDETLRGDFATVAYRIQLLGFNAIRLPFSFLVREADWYAASDLPSQTPPKIGQSRTNWQTCPSLYAYVCFGLCSLPLNRWLLNLMELLKLHHIALSRHSNGVRFQTPQRQMQICSCTCRICSRIHLSASHILAPLAQRLRFAPTLLIHETPPASQPMHSHPALYVTDFSSLIPGHKTLLQSPKQICCYDSGLLVNHIC